MQINDSKKILSFASESAGRGVCLTTVACGSWSWWAGAGGVPGHDELLPRHRDQAAQEGGARTPGGALQVRGESEECATSLAVKMVSRSLALYLALSETD